MGSRVITEAVSEFQSGGERAAGQYLEDLQRTQNLRGFVFDSSGHEISGRMVFPWIEDMRRTGHVRRHSSLDRFLPERFYRQNQNVQGQDYTLVLEFPLAREYSVPMAFPALALPLQLFSSGLVCYLLAWSLTSPVARLRHATQRLAAGDLTARTGAPMKGRRDEIGQLMRDFDRMAERIEALMEAQSRLLKDVSHELRSPLARLSVALGLARQRATPEAESALARIELETIGLTN